MSRFARIFVSALLVGFGLLAAGCAGPTGIQPRGLSADTLPLDLERFMGDWYVIAHIPLSPEAQAHEAVETYALADDGTIDVTFTFCDGALDGPREVITMRAWVHDPATNAEWRAQPFWPLRFMYQITELDPDYRTTVVESGSNAWVMARTATMPEDELQAALDRLVARGFVREDVRRVPHADGSCRNAG